MGEEERQKNVRFDVQDEFEGGEFINGEFFYQNKKRKRKQTDNDRVYGVFAGNSGKYLAKCSNLIQPTESPSTMPHTPLPFFADDDEGMDYKGAGKSLSKPINFVGGKVEKTNITEDVEMEEPPAGNGLGLGGLGYRPPPPSSGGRNKEKMENEQEIDDEEIFMPTAFGKRIKAAADARRKQSETSQRRQKEPDRTTAATKNHGAGRSDIGKFEKHTKGIGSKLLAKMGWKEGHGLGRDGKGLAKPLEVKLRPRNMGMGYGQEREPQLVAPSSETGKTGKTATTSAAAAAARNKGDSVDIQAEAKLWKKRNADLRGKRSMKTADQVTAETAAAPVASLLSRPTIIDMRGPQARVVTTLEHLNVLDTGTTPIDGSLGPMPELQHNIKLLVDLTEADIQRLDAKSRAEQDTAEILAAEAHRLRSEQEASMKAKERLHHIVQQVEAASRMDALTAMYEQYHALHAEYKEDYIMYNLSATALAACLPLFMKKVKKWSPMKMDDGDDDSSSSSSKVLIREISAWRPLLEDKQRQKTSTFGAQTDPYTRLLIELYLPRLRRDITNHWNPRDPGIIDTFFDVWQPLLPPPLLHHILESLILPTLKAAVKEWDPINDPVALHTWVHPWLPYLEHYLSELWPIIRHKFSTALQAWHPSDTSAHAILAPWSRVFQPKEWEQLLGRSIIPQLAAALQPMQINPAAQDAEPFSWLMAWADVMPSRQVTALLEVNFFPKWHSILHHWLNNAPDYDEVTRWYLGWKSMFPNDLLDNEKIKGHMNSALDAMNAALDGKQLPPIWTHPPPTHGPGPGPGGGGEDHTAAYDGRSHKHTRHAHEVELSIKDIVEQYAADIGVEFVPKGGGRTMHDGLQVYSFGGVGCVVDPGVGLIKAHRGSEWVAVSLEDLVDMAEKKKKKKNMEGKK